MAFNPEKPAARLIDLAGYRPPAKSEHQESLNHLPHVDPENLRKYELFDGIDDDDDDILLSDIPRHTSKSSSSARRRIILWTTIGGFIASLVLIFLTFQKKIQAAADRADQLTLEKVWPEFSTADKFTFGKNSNVNIGVNVTQIGVMDDQFLPGHKDPNSRLIIIGDVHGHKSALENLLAKVNYDPRDHVIFAGDMISKGPDSVGTIELAQRINASCVRGNHEDRVLSAWETIRRSSLEDEDLGSVVYNDENDQEDDYAQSDEGYISVFSTDLVGKKDRKLARKFDNSHISWLSSCPIILDVGNITNFGHLLVVHAGLVPGVKLNKQDPFQVMNMRAIDLTTNVPSSRPKDGMAWTKLWNHFQNKAPPSRRRKVAYGHDARNGLQLKDYTYGLDSGCGNRERLSAMVIDPNGVTRIDDVRCRKKV